MIFVFVVERFKCWNVKPYYLLKLRLMQRFSLINRKKVHFFDIALGLRQEEAESSKQKA